MSNSKEISSKLIFCQKLPRHFDPETLVIYDRRLSRVSDDFRRWLKKMPVHYGVHGGEPLKDVRHFPTHIAKILELSANFSRLQMGIVAVGGGSVGDFSGFVASVLKRGVKLTHIPSTWLAALDSAHGGKNALNVMGLKNQIGTFYGAGQVYLVRSLLETQPDARASDAYGELAKMALIDGGKWTRQLLGGRTEGHALLWAHLRASIEAKMAVVERDPFEEKGLRAVLNFGHTFGHVLESCRSVSHGGAVAQGLYFALRWSLQRGIISLRDYFQCAQLLNPRLKLPCWLEDDKKFQPIAMSTFMKALKHDKKRSSSDQLTFVFLRKWGRPVLQKVKLGDVATEARRQGWVQ